MNGELRDSFTKMGRRLDESSRKVVHLMLMGGPESYVEFVLGLKGFRVGVTESLSLLRR